MHVRDCISLAFVGVQVAAVLRQLAPASLCTTHGIDRSSVRSSSCMLLLRKLDRTRKVLGHRTCHPRAMTSSEDDKSQSEMKMRGQANCAQQCKILMALGCCTEAPDHTLRLQRHGPAVAADAVAPVASSQQAASTAAVAGRRAAMSLFRGGLTVLGNMRICKWNYMCTAVAAS